MEEYYRFAVNGVGIYELIQREVGQNDSRRKNKPDGSWLIKKGIDHPGSISFWTKSGLKKYLETGLLEWHLSCISGNVSILVIDKPTKIEYEDENQIIIKPEFVNSKREIIISKDNFLEITTKLLTI